VYKLLYLGHGRQPVSWVGEASCFAKRTSCREVGGAKAQGVLGGEGDAGEDASGAVCPPYTNAYTYILTRPRGQGLLQVVDLKPIPLAHGHRIHGLSLPEAAVGVGPLGAFGGYVLMPVMNERGLFWNLAPSGLTCWALLSGNARETWGRELLADLPAVLGDRGFRWVQGVKTPPYRVRGGKVVETGWRGWMGRVRNWIETRFSVMVRSLGLHRIAAFPSGKHLVARSYWGLVARVNLILLVHNLIRSRVLLRMAGVEL
jgi:hypothetical protein